MRKTRETRIPIAIVGINVEVFPVKNRHQVSNFHSLLTKVGTGVTEPEESEVGDPCTL